MSVSRESTSLKKSCGDCLKLAKQWYSILSDMMLFRNYCIFPGSAEALVRCGGNLQQLLIAYFLGNVCQLPNIMKIWRCFLKLQLKMLGCFSLRHSVWYAYSVLEDLYPLAIKYVIKFRTASHTFAYNVNITSFPVWICKHRGSTG